MFSQVSVILLGVGVRSMVNGATSVFRDGGISGSNWTPDIIRWNKDGTMIGIVLLMLLGGSRASQVNVLVSPIKTVKHIDSFGDI